MTLQEALGSYASRTDLDVDDDLDDDNNAIYFRPIGGAPIGGNPYENGSSVTPTPMGAYLVTHNRAFK